MGELSGLRNLPPTTPATPATPATSNMTTKWRASVFARARGELRALPQGSYDHSSVTNNRIITLVHESTL